MKLRTKFAVLLLVVTVGLSLVAYGGLEAYKHQQVESTRESVSETAAISAEQIDEELFSEMDRVGSYAGEMRLDDPNATRRALDALTSRREFQHGAVVDDAGTVVMVAGPYSETGRERMVSADVSDGACVGRTLRTGDLCISPPEAATGSVFGEASHYVRLTAPVFDGDGRVDGAVVVTYPLTERGAFVALRPLDTSSLSVTVTAGERTLYDGGGTGDGIVATATVERTGWEVRVERSRAALNATLRQLALTQAASILLLVLIAVGFAYWEYTVNLRQTGRLLDGFEALSAGEYDRRLDLAAGEEWERIGDGFGTLAADLAARERALQASEQRLEVLNRVLRHNLRNRLNVVLSAFDMVRETGDATAADWAERGAAAGRRLEELAETAGRVQAALADDDDPEPTRVDGVVRAAAEAVAADHPDATVAVDAESAVAMARPAVGEAVEELVENACVHAGDAPTVTVTVHAVDAADGDRDRVRIGVRDDGPGIPEYERDVIERGHETDLDHGSGLGLWLAHWVADRCGGELAFPRAADGGYVELRLPPPPAAGDDTADEE
ncbi:sensor histidine kinase [Candidatus Halobonum tyrrellensis]|uniref:sensor histidine kinase n=1 Tax=Candidatus Halobonum tyrrellensis TaxID=1431545 RepID=UPI000677A481|nr:ATP-binding protein [Candidatus Halobonum tyrrellensis]